MIRATLSAAAFGLIFVLTLAGGGGVAQADSGSPPVVRTGTAASICGQIRAAGYSPHDYVYQVKRGGQPYTVPTSTRTTDYTHVILPNTLLTWRSLLPTSGSNYIYLTDGGASRGTDTLIHTGNGTLTDLDGNALTNDANSGNNGGGGHDGYIWTATGGVAVTFRDVFVQRIEYPLQPGWSYQPNWSGPEGARMSAIWRSVPACTAD